MTTLTHEGTWVPKKTPRRKPGPVVIKRGSESVTIYHGRRKVEGRVYPIYTLIYYGPDGSRVRRNFSSVEEARSEAERAEKVSSSRNAARADSV